MYKLESVQIEGGVEVKEVTCVAFVSHTELHGAVSVSRQQVRGEFLG